MQGEEEPVAPYIDIVYRAEFSITEYLVMYKTTVQGLHTH